MSATLPIVLGLLGLLLGGELLVRGAVSAARSFGISPMVIGLTLVGFGTSSPELVTSLQAALSGSSGIAVGNVVGSNIGNVLKEDTRGPVRLLPTGTKYGTAIVTLRSWTGVTPKGCRNFRDLGESLRPCRRSKNLREYKGLKKPGAGLSRVSDVSPVVLPRAAGPRAVRREARQQRSASRPGPQAI